MSDAAPAAPSTDAPTKPSLLLRAQYIKDLSFENPRAPASLFQLREAPMMEVSVNLSAARMDEFVVELSMQIAVRAISDKTTVFLADLVYAGLLELRGIADEQAEQAIFVAGAQLIYPFARRVIADVSRDGGFPALQLEPLDFAGMYAERRGGAASAE